MFQGSATPSIDAKNRLLFPAKWRNRLLPEDFLAGFWCTLGPDGCLQLLTSAEFLDCQRRVDPELGNAEKRALDRFFFGMAEHLAPDPQGRLLMPMQLLALVGIEREVLAIGVRRRIELWAPPRYEDFQRAHLPRYFDRLHELFLPSASPPVAETSDALRPPSAARRPATASSDAEPAAT